MQRGGAGLPIENQVDDVPPPGKDPHFRFVSVLGKGADTRHFALDVVGQFLKILPFEKLHVDSTMPLIGVRTHFVNAVQTPDSLFDNQDQALLDLLGAGPWVRSPDPYDVPFGAGEHLLCDLAQHEKTTHKTDHHDQVGGNGVVGHPPDRTTSDQLGF